MCTNLSRGNHTANCPLGSGGEKWKVKTFGCQDRLQIRQVHSRLTGDVVVGGFEAFDLIQRLDIEDDNFAASEGNANLLGVRSADKQ